MALINCPECSNRISDKANSCPSCGFPIQSTQYKSDEYLVCPKCSSKNISVQKAGFSGKKAVAGAFVTGGIGILAGTIGSKNIYITCLVCNHRFKSGDAKIIRSKRAESELDEKVLQVYRETNNSMKAIRFYKNATNKDFLQASEYVNELLEKNFKSYKNAGCLVAILIVLIIGGVLFI